jgi:putative methionine-R-sulfoxide reductase with GAF domain
MADTPRKTPIPTSESAPPDLRKEADLVLQNLTKGSRLTEEFIREQGRLLARTQELEQENTRLRAQLEADDAVRELLAKIALLEHEKRDLLSRFEAVEEASNEFDERRREFESEFANLANLFVASNQIHASMSPRGVTRRIKEVLAQLVGAESYAMYMVDNQNEELVPIASEGMPAERLVSVRAQGSRLGEVAQSGSAVVDEDVDSSIANFDSPPAIVPLAIDDRVVGVIAIFSTLAQKTRFDTTDFELFKLLGQHAAAALVSASLFAKAERRIPGLEAFLDLSV